MNVRVLLVDDHHDVRTSLAQRLQGDPHLDLVGAAGSLEEAAALLRQAGTDTDIVLLDIHGHNGHGLEVCRTLHELTDAPVVLFTSFMTPELWAAGREAGAADLLLKHIDTDRLSREILRLADRHRERRYPDQP
jgi:DNA-binding NarL/FixJ family response regulator